jgi:hypothetical protein
LHWSTAKFPRENNAGTESGLSFVTITLLSGISPVLQTDPMNVTWTARWPPIAVRSVVQALVTSNDGFVGTSGHTAGAASAVMVLGPPAVVAAATLALFVGPLLVPELNVNASAQFAGFGQHAVCPVAKFPKSKVCKAGVLPAGNVSVTVTSYSRPTPVLVTVPLTSYKKAVPSGVNLPLTQAFTMLTLQSEKSPRTKSLSVAVRLVEERVSTKNVLTQGTSGTPAWAKRAVTLMSAAQSRGWA